MHNWSVDTTQLEKDKDKFAIWKLEQMVNFGTDGEKVKASELEKYWEQLNLDPAKKNFIGFLLWGEKFLTNDKTIS